MERFKLIKIFKKGHDISENGKDNEQKEKVMKLKLKSVTKWLRKPRIQVTSPL